MNITKQMLENVYVKENLGLEQTSKKLKIPRRKIRKLLDLYNIPIKKRPEERKYIANDNFFSSWSEDMAYCLGFISADGHIWKDKPYISVNITQNDDIVIKYIRDLISPESKIRLQKNNVCQLTITSKQIHKDLSDFGLHNNKTFDMPLPNVPEVFWGDYLRGYFDGDGSIWKTNFRNGKDYYYANIISGCNNFIKLLHNRLQFGIVSTVRKKYTQIKFCQSDCLRFAKIIYKNPYCFKLERKYNKFQQINTKYSFWSIEEENILKNNVNLPKEQLLLLLPKRNWSAISRKINKKYAYLKN